ncbi:hypothetical protein ACRRTK_014497 [Alexandromys fortis]
MDVAASEFFRSGKYDLEFKSPDDTSRHITLTSWLTCISPSSGMNRIGSVTESLQSYKLAQFNSWGVMVSHRFGKTEDTFVADLVVGLCTRQIKRCPLPI